MRTERIVPSAEMRVDAREIETRTRQAMQEADVSRVSVKDPHGHTLIEVPVVPADVPMVLEPVLAAVRAVGETVGEVTLRVEKTPGLPEAAGERGQQTTAAVTQRDVDQMNEANRVPAGDEATMKRIAPEQAGEPDLKDTGEWPHARRR